MVQNWQQAMAQNDAHPLYNFLHSRCFFVNRSGYFAFDAINSLVKHFFSKKFLQVVFCSLMTMAMVTPSLAQETSKASKKTRLKKPIKKSTVLEGEKLDRVHKLNCKKLDYLLGYTPGFQNPAAGQIAQICNRAALLCHTEKWVFAKSKKDPLRKEVEKWLEREIRLELDLCQVTIDHFKPELLTVIPPQ